MNNCQNNCKLISEGYSLWYEKNKWLIKIIGLSWTDASFFRGQISHIINDLRKFLHSIFKNLLISLCILIILSILNFYFVRNLIKLSYLIAYYFGLVGTFFASYGYVIYSKGLITQKQEHKTFINIRPNNISQVLADYINSDTDQKLHLLKLEIRKQISLIIAFILLCISFAIQLILQFFKNV